jgi:two-component system chemotaxis sensor kinase CheA
MLPFEDLAPLGPQRFSHSGNKQVKLEYYPLRNSEGKMEGVVVVATDITELVQAQHQAETEAANVQMILSLLKNRGQTHRFIQEAQNLLEDLHHDLEKGVNCDPDSLFRVLHTLKGGAATYSIKTVTETCHASETLLQEWKSFSETTQSQESWNALATKAKQIPEQFQNFLKDNEPIIGKAERFKERWLEFPISDFYDFSDKHLQYHHEIRRHFNYTFLYEPLKSYFSSYDEVVQGVAETTGKQVDRIFVDNSDLKIWPEPYNNLLSTFVHAFRNAVDHGIELPEKRQEVGKPIAGQIHVSFLRNKKGLLFTIRDDGGGIDPAEIRAKLSAKGLDVAGESDKQVIQHIFDSSFSTKEQVTEVSGRGVGMDAIRYAAEALGGKVWVRSVVGKGTELFVHVPWIESKMSLAMTAA